MDFFESQERAKRNTSWLVALFIMGVIATVVSVHVVLSLTVSQGKIFDPSMFALSVGSVLAVVGVGTAVKFAQMSHGGAAVAQAMGGIQVDPGSSDPDERRILNVVEEMAIASGVRVPPVYLMEDQTINAFAAGNSEQDSVIGVTRGCIHALSRDELQGVMAHEFSHIFHRDTRLNMRLVAWLGGIFAVSMVGRILIRSQMYSRPSRDKNSNAAIGLGIGVALFIIGIVGYFFGRIIQSAVSRQREFLADASAVQYTRNPDGIAGALEKIARGAGSQLSAPAAAEFSHFFFANGIASLFSTHPPIEDRIARIRGAKMVEAGVTAAATNVATTATNVAPTPTLTAAKNLGVIQPATTARASSVAAFHGVSAAAIHGARRSMGSLNPLDLGMAHGLIAGLPESVVDAARNPFSARAVICSLLLARDRRERQAQLARIATIDPALANATGALQQTASITPRQRLPVIELCAASLAQLSPAQYQQFRAVLAQLIASDSQVDRLEWTVRVILRGAIEGPIAVKDTSARATVADVAMVASVLAWSGATDEVGVARAWRAARGSEPLLPAAQTAAHLCTLDALDESLQRLSNAKLGTKRKLVDACVACVVADGQTTVEEAELLRAVCASIGAPMPPIATAA
jgi:Zn-dependent protease with chaperone function